MIKIATIEDEKNIREKICQTITSVTKYREEIEVDSYSSAEEYFWASKKYELVITDVFDHVYSYGNPFQQTDNHKRL